MITTWEADDRERPDSAQVVAQRFARLTEIANTGDLSDEALLEPAKLVFGPNGVLSEPDPDYVSRETFLASEIEKLGCYTQTRQDCLNADPDDFITDALCEGELTPELRTQLLWVMATYSDKIDWDFQVGFAVDHGYAGTLAMIMDEANVQSKRPGG